jgi:DNA-nicking Smr family endonuclease
LKLRRGNYPIDARLDLHGLTQSEAHVRLAEFLAAAQVRGNRCVLVITGRGLRQGGALREMTPRWLDEPPNRSLVLSFTQSQIRHGGEGALYVLLRRRDSRGGRTTP